MDAKVKERLDQIDENLYLVFENFKDSRVPIIVRSETSPNAITAETPYKLYEDYLDNNPCAYLKLEVNLPCTVYYYVTGQSTRTEHYELVTSKKPFIWEKKNPKATITRIDIKPSESSGTTVKFVCSTVRLTIAEEMPDIITERLIYKKSADIGAIVAGAEMSAGVDLVVEAGSVNGYKIKNVTMVINEDTDLRVKFYSHDSDQGTSENTNMILGYADLTDPILDSGEYVQSIDCDINLVDVDGSGEIHYIVENIGSTATTVGYLKFVIQEAST